MVLPVIGAAAGAAARGAASAAGAAARGAGSAAKSTAGAAGRTTQGAEAAAQGGSNNFLLSAARRKARYNAYRQFNDPDRRKADYPSRKGTGDSPAEQEEAYTTGAGASDTGNNLDQLRQLAREAQLAATADSTLGTVTQGVRTGLWLRQGLGRSSFNDWLLIGLAFFKDCMDFVLEVASLGITLGLLAASFGLFITVLIIVVRMFRGGGISRFIMRWFLIFLIDITIGQYLLFIPIATLGMILLVRQEREKALRTQGA